MLRLLLSCACVAAACASVPAGFTLLASTDLTPCVPPCARVGTPNPCGNYPPTQGPCDVDDLAAQCRATCGCVAFNSNGWLKGCGNASCGASTEGTPGTDTYILGDGMPAPAWPPAPVAEQVDVHWPPEEPAEAAGGL